MARATGTREWAEHTYNIARGCSHGCLYCYARAFALRFERIKSRKEWLNMEVNAKKVIHAGVRHQGRIMFPTSHDITPEILPEFMKALTVMLAAGNKVLITSKPHYKCIDEMVTVFKEYKSQIMFRFTIGSLDEAILKFWEPGAPAFQERFACLVLAYSAGFKTSVSCEPLLNCKAVKLFRELSPYTTDGVWLGGMNDAKERIGKGVVKKIDEAYIQGALNAADPAQVWGYYEKLKDELQIRWKDSFKKILGIDSGEVGEDK